MVGRLHGAGVAALFAVASMFSVLALAHEPVLAEGPRAPLVQTPPSSPPPPTPRPTPSVRPSPAPSANLDDITGQRTSAQRWVSQNMVGALAALLYESSKGLYNAFRYQGGSPSSGQDRAIIPVRSSDITSFIACIPFWQGERPDTSFTMADLSHRVPYELTSCFAPLRGMLGAMTTLTSALYIGVLLYGVLRLLAQRLGFSWNARSFILRALGSAGAILFAGLLFTWAVGLANDIPTTVLRSGSPTPLMLDLFRSDQIEASTKDPELSLSYVIPLAFYVAGVIALTVALFLRIVMINALFVFAPLAAYFFMFDETRAYAKQWLTASLGLLASIPVVAVVLDIAGSLVAVSAGGKYLLAADVQLLIGGGVLFASSGLVFAFVRATGGGLMQTLNTGAAASGPGALLGMLGSRLGMPGARRAGEPTIVPGAGAPAGAGAAATATEAPAAAAPATRTYSRWRPVPAATATSRSASADAPAFSSRTGYVPRSYSKRNLVTRIASHHKVGTRVRGGLLGAARGLDSAFTGGLVQGTGKRIGAARGYAGNLKAEELQARRRFEADETMNVVLARMVEARGGDSRDMPPLDENDIRALRKLATGKNTPSKDRDRAVAALRRRGIGGDFEEHVLAAQALVREANFEVRRQDRARRQLVRHGRVSAVAPEIDRAAEAWSELEPDDQRLIRDFVEDSSTDPATVMEVAHIAQQLGLGSLDRSALRRELRKVMTHGSELTGDGPALSGGSRAARSGAAPETDAPDVDRESPAIERRPGDVDPRLMRPETAWDRREAGEGPVPRDMGAETAWDRAQEKLRQEGLAAEQRWRAQELPEAVRRWVAASESRAKSGLVGPSGRTPPLLSERESRALAEPIEDPRATREALLRVSELLEMPELRQLSQGEAAARVIDILHQLPEEVRRRDVLRDPFEGA